MDKTSVWDKTLLRSYGKFDLYRIQRRGGPVYPRFWLKYRDIFVSDTHFEPSSKEIAARVEDWIDGQLNYLEFQKHLEPLIDDQNELVRNAAENFEFHLENQDEFVQDPFRFKLIEPGRYKTYKLIEPGTYLVFILEKYVDWDYFSSSDIGEFRPTSPSDTHGFRAFLNDWIVGSAQDKIDRELRRQIIQEDIEEVRNALLDWMNSGNS
ncbi:hypothetical protein [Alicyclobacillus sp. ALC3]|uniref:hypothetical protein n=1 Tax=Alicyclobacillus sp. ALC3 TaxID=2796143 RepID=UPI002377E948|nr:hypothetical protein [Alicyclobacillus sp. ALC3]WDL98402.1 hypothetical protein JC200_06875 [Alicyclobacillus sp. ALC3]